ncbi:MAG: SusC/RagA family TonB-linked outer membrane protein [Roseivirga sp.]
MKRVLLTLLMSVLVCVYIQAQTRTVSGKVTDETGQPLPQVTVLLKGTTTGTPTDADGNFRLSVPDAGGTLLFRFLGYVTQEIEIGTQSVINLQLQPEVTDVGEVVVTALGITREKASLGYAVTSIGANDIQSRPEADVSRILRGKVPGVDITSTSGLAGSGTNIIIRGYSSITGNNQPLFVIDGVPFNTDTNNDRSFAAGGATASSRFLDLDPNNIADISILKGLSATVLYGEAGRNGVVLVTTKTGGGDSGNNKMDISLTQSVFVNQVGGVVEDQDQYGNGWQNFASAAFSNWGAPFDQPNRNGLTDGTIAHPYSRSALNDVFPELIGARYDYRAYDNLQNFFVTGTQINTSLGINSRIGDNSSISFNQSYLKDGGYIPNNEFEKHNTSLGFRTKLNNGLSIAASGNFISSKRITPPAAPIYSSNPISGTSLFSNVLYTPRSVDLHGLAYERPDDNSSIYYRGGNDIQHPLWTLNNVSDDETVNRFFGNVTFNYKLADWLNVSYRFGLDTYDQQQDFTQNKGGRQNPDGLFTTSDRSNTITDQVLTFSANKDLNADWNINGLLGVNLRRETSTSNFITSTQQFIYGLFTHNNFITNVATSGIREVNTNGIYGQVSLGYQGALFVNLSARNDWTSTLEPENRSVFYPSVSVSILPFDLAQTQVNGIEYLKVRLGYGTSAGYPGPYQTRNILSTSPNRFIDGGGTIINSNSISTRFGNPNLERELHEEFELGVEARMLNNKVNLDLSFYQKKSSDLIIDLDLDPSTGFTNSTINAAEIENKGLEAQVSVRVIEKADWNLMSTVNFTTNEGTVNSVAPGIDQVVISGFSFLGNFAIPGQPYGIIQGSRIQRNDAGQPIISASGTYQQDTDIGIIGDPNPDYNLSWINEIGYKFLSLRVQIDYVHGGDIWGSTASTLTGRGIAGETGFDRFVPVVATGVKADGSPNDVQITPNRHYWEHTGVFYDENRMFDATTLRLREISLSVVAPSSWLTKTPFGSASLTFSGQNLWYKAFNFPESINFDPEVLSLGVGNGRGFDYVTGPTSKKYGATLSLTF